MWRSAQPVMSWPEGRRFAFTIFDDTDWTTVANAGPVYDVLSDLGMRITKSVWVDPPGPARTTGGGTCADSDYLDWVVSLMTRGHEIGYHNATDRSSTRSETVAALDRFEQLFGHAPRVGADHAGNREALYAGSKRLSGSRSAAYRALEVLTRRQRPSFEGEDPASPYYWGDVARARIDYWRLFSFARTSLTSVGPVLFHDPEQACVNTWFNSAHGPRRADFVRRLDRQELDRLENDGGLCIMYTHFGLDFVDERNRPNADVVEVMTGLASRDGWFVPVSEVLDHVRSTAGVEVLGTADRARLERAWILDRLRDRSSFGPAVATHVRSEN